MSLKDATSSVRRIDARNALLGAFKTTLDGLPVKVSSAGSLSFDPTITQFQFEEVMRTIGVFGSNSSTLVNFAKGDAWIAASANYGDGTELMRRIYGEEFALKQAMMWRVMASVARRVPLQDRDISRTWAYYRYKYNKEQQCCPIKGSVNEETIPAVDAGARHVQFTDLEGGLKSAEISVYDNTVALDADCVCGRRNHASIKRKVFEEVTQYTLLDRETGEVI